MKLILGIGNPDRHYEHTRHNAGFVALDALAGKYGVSWQHKNKFSADIAFMQTQDVLLVKPTTYYNVVGEAAHAIAHFYHLKPRDILIIHDDLALPFGTLRSRIGGRDAGNNGIKSINAHLGQDTCRLRIGIANNQSITTDASQFVLMPFTHQEKQHLHNVIVPVVYDYIDTFVDDRWVSTTTTTLSLDTQYIDDRANTHDTQD